MPRTKQFQESVVLEKAMRLFWERGYEGTALSDLTHFLGIGKGSFYGTFGSKKELFVRVLEVYASARLHEQEAVLAAHPHYPVAGIGALLEQHTAFVLHPSQPRGCLLTNTATECASDGAVQSLLAQHQQALHQQLTHYLHPHTAAPTLPALADTIVTHLAGISVMAKVHGDADRIAASHGLMVALVRNNVEC